MNWIIDHCPKGRFRFLFQSVGAESKDAAESQIFRIFRRVDGIYVKGVYLPPNRNSAIYGPWTFKENGGWMVFVPD